MKERPKNKRGIRLSIPDAFGIEVSLADMKNRPIGVYRVMDVSATGLGLHVPTLDHTKTGQDLIIERASVRATLRSSTDGLKSCGLFLNEKIDGNIRWRHDVKEDGTAKNAGIELYPREDELLFSLFGECLNEYLNNGNENHVRELIRKEVTFDKSDDGESLYKYIFRVLAFMDNFLNCNIGMIGYIDIVRDGGERIVTDVGSVFTGFEQDKYRDPFNKKMGRKISELKLSDDYKENQSEGYSCKAHSYKSEQIYVIQYPDGAGEDDFNPEAFDKISGNMKMEDVMAAKAGRFIRIHNDITSEITIPLKPWYRHDYDQEHSPSINNTIEQIKAQQFKTKDGTSVEVLIFPGDRSEKIDTENIKKRFLIANDPPNGKAKGGLLVRCPPDMTEAQRTEIQKFLNDMASSDQEWQGMVNDLFAKSKDDEVIAVLNFEFSNKNDIVNQEGFKTIRRIMEIIREEVEIELANALFSHYNSFRALIYHSLINNLMGEPQHAFNELGKWREVQCRIMFRNYQPLKSVLEAFREFFAREVQSGSVCGDEGWRNPNVADGESYRRVLGLSDKGTPDSIHDGRSGFALFQNHHNYGAEGIEVVLEIERYLMPGVHLHFLLQKMDALQDVGSQDPSLRNLDAEERELFLRKASNVALQIGPTEWGLHLAAVRTEYLQALIKSLESSTDDKLKHFLGKYKPENDIVYLQKGLQQNFFDNLGFAGEERKGQRLRYLLDYFLHMRFLIGIAQLHHIIRERGETNFTFNELEIVDDGKRDFILRFIGICSLMILTESVNARCGKGAPEQPAEGSETISLPLAVAYLYRAKAYLLLGEDRRAFCDLVGVERFVETSSNNFQQRASDKHKPCFGLSKKRAEQFSHWLKVLLNYHKGRVFFASFAKTQSLLSFCRSMEKLKYFNATFGVRPRLTTINSMIYKGKTFFELGRYSRSLKWYLKAVLEIVDYADNLRIDLCEDERSFWTAEQRSKVVSLIELLEEYKHNAFIKKQVLANGLDVCSPEVLFKSSDLDKVCMTGRLLSDVLNRIGFILFDLNLPKSESTPTKASDAGDNRNTIAFAWIKKALEIDSTNGFAKFNELLIKYKDPGVIAETEFNKHFVETFSHMGRFYRKFYPMILHWLVKWQHGIRKQGIDLTSKQRIYVSLLHYQLRYIDDFIRKPAEIYEYLIGPRTIPRELTSTDDPAEGLYFLCRYSSWSPKLPRPRIFSIKGGGKFLVWRGKGILIDPGFDLLYNLYAEGFSLADVDAIIVTHDHLDHTNDFESLWRLIKEHNEVIRHSSLPKNEKTNRMINLTLFTNLGFEQKCSRFLSSDPEKTYVRRIHPLSRNSRLSPEGFAFDIRVLEAKHKEDLTRDYPIGFILELKNEPNTKEKHGTETVFTLGFTSDTQFHPGLKELYHCDLVVANISNATFRELKVKLELKEFPENDEYKEFLDGFSKNDHRKEKDIISWCLWYSRDREDWIKHFMSNENEIYQNISMLSQEMPTILPGLLEMDGERLVCRDVRKHGENVLLKRDQVYEWAGQGNKDKLDKFFRRIKELLNPGVLASHLGVSGIYQIWEGMKGKVKHTEKHKLLILSEFREEMGSFRNKVAHLLNETHLSQHPSNNQLRCLTGDIGMAVKFVPSKAQEERRSKIRCSVCSNDNDLYRPAGAMAYSNETFYMPDSITEVCIKGEAEGMFYLCKAHETGPKQLFIERMNKFDLFNEEEIPL